MAGEYRSLIGHRAGPSRFHRDEQLPSPRSATSYRKSHRIEPLRVVLDTSVIVARLRSRRGASHHLLELVAAERLVLLVTTALFLEYE